jgi:hypothetical protein
MPFGSQWFAASGSSRESLKTTIDGLGKSAQIIMDSADSDCYPGSGQNLLDLSGNDYDFFLGTSASAVAGEDPVFVGSAGDMSADTYFSFTGTADQMSGKTFKQNITAGSLPAWLQNVSKSTAGVFTACIMINYIQDPGQNHQPFIGTNYPTANAHIGFSFMIEGGAAYKPAIYIGKGGSASDGFYNLVDTALPTGPHMLALSFNNGGTSFYYRDGAYDQVSSADTFTPTIATQTANPLNQLNICSGPTVASSGNTHGTAVVGTKFYSCFLDNTAWSKAELDGVWEKVQPWLEDA